MKFSAFFLVMSLFVFGQIYALAGNYHLQVSDVPEIRVVGKSDLTTKQPITPDGTISLPFIGRVAVEGKTLSELDSTLTNQFTKYVRPA